MDFTSLIRKAIALIAALWDHVNTLATDNAALRASLADANARLTDLATTGAAAIAARTAAEQHDTDTQEANSALRATVNDLNSQQADLAKAITDHPDVALAVAPDLTVVQDKGLVFPAPPVPAAPTPEVETVPVSLPPVESETLVAGPDGVKMDPGSDTLKTDGAE